MKSRKKSARKTAKKAAKKVAKKSIKKIAKKATRRVAKKAAKRRPNAAFMAPLFPSQSLAEVIGTKSLPRTEIVKRIWNYIKKNGLQDKKNKRMINADATLKVVFGGKDQISMFELAKVVTKNTGPIKPPYDK